MPITIHNPQPAAAVPRRPRAVDIDMDVPSDSDSDSETGGAAIQGDIPMLDDESIAQDEDDEDEEQGDTRDEILTPGTVITSNSQWMRYCYLYLSHLHYPFHPSISRYSCLHVYSSTKLISHTCTCSFYKIQ